MNKIIEVYEAGSTLAIKGCGLVGVVEKAVIGQNNAISYQLICYAPERHQQVINDFEVDPVEGKVSKIPIGFASTPAVDRKEITILLDESNKFVDIQSSDDILVGTAILNAEEVLEYQTLLEEAEENETQEEAKEEEEL